MTGTSPIPGQYTRASIPSRAPACRLSSAAENDICDQIVDLLANAAFYYGVVRVLADEDRPIWSQMSFSAAEENFHAGAREGIDANVFWPGVGEVPVTELVLRRLLPMAHGGLATWGVDAADRDRLLGVIEQRCLKGVNGASWQADTFHKLYEDDQLDRTDALREMTIRYRDLMHSNEPVHDWPVAER